MRAVPALVLFVFAAALAACGGGGHGSIVPSSGTSGGSGGNSAPSSAKSTHAAMSIYVPAAGKQAASRKPMYVPSYTAAFAVYVTPYPSGTPYVIPSAIPAGVQVFPVTTPSPCAVASGGYTCTLTVTAPIGNDLFVVAALPNASPNPSTAPLAVYISGSIAVSASPAPNATPLSFTLAGDVYYVAISVPSPDPSNTPNTQVFTALVSQTATLGITAYDSDKRSVLSPASQPFITPIVISASPASDGVTLSLVNASQCGSTASGGAASIACAGDLDDLQVSYDGSTHPDPSDHPIDTFVIAATAQPSAAPSPATVVLASNLVLYPSPNPLASDVYIEDAFLMPTTTSGTLLYAYNNDGSFYTGTFTTANGTATSPVQLTGLSEPVSVAVAPNGTVWVADLDDGTPYVACWNSVTAFTTSGNGPNSPDISPLDPAESPIDIAAMAIDEANDVWIVGYDPGDDGQNFLGYFNAASGCPTSTPTAVWFTLSGESYDYSANLAADPSGTSVVFASTSNGTFGASANGIGGTSTPNPPAIGSGATSDSIAMDQAGNAYGFFTLTTTDLEESAGGVDPLTSLLSLPPTNASPEPAQPEGATAFSISAGSAADRISFPERNYGALGIVQGLSGTKSTLLMALPLANNVYQTGFGAHGQAYALFQDVNENLWIARAVTTTTWSAPVGQLINYPGQCEAGLFSINERQTNDSFSLTFPEGGGSYAALSGSSRDLLLTVPSSTIPVVVKDQNGRTETTTASVYENC